MVERRSAADRWGLPRVNSPGHRCRRAVVADRYGKLERLTLRDLAIPPLATDEVLVKVCASAISPGDRALITGTPYVNRLAGNGLGRPKRQIPAFDVAGVVEAIGSDVERFTVGDHVFGNADGSLTNRAIALARQLAPRPDEWTCAQAAAVPESGCVALQAVRDHAAIRPGCDVAVLGAGGGVGTYVTQLALARGARITAVCGTAKMPGVAALGVDEVADYHDSDLRDLDHRFDLVIDTAGTTPLHRIVPALTPTGRLVIIGADHSRRVTGGLGRWLRSLALSAVSRRRLRPFVGRPVDAQLLADLVDAFRRGDVRPAIDRTFPFDESIDAFEYLDHRERPGKVVIVVDPDCHAHANDTTRPRSVRGNEAPCTD